MVDREQLLDELARCYAHAAVDRLLDEHKDPEGGEPRGLRSCRASSDAERTPAHANPTSGAEAAPQSAARLTDYKPESPSLEQTRRVLTAERESLR